MKILSNFIKEWKFRRFMKKRNKEFNAEFDKKFLNALIDEGILDEKYRLK